MTAKILIVDDSATVRREVTAALEGFELIEATNGLEGAKVIETCDDLDLVICDVNMPHMNGIEMLERVKDRCAAASIKIIMLTSEGQPEIINRARELGAKGWVVKPFNPEQLLAAARKLTSTEVVG